MKLKNILAACFVAASFAVVGNATADIVFDIIETDGNVQATVSGSLNLDATLGFVGIATNTTPFFQPDAGLVTVGDQQSDYYEISQSPWFAYGSGGFQEWDTTSGDRVAMFSTPFFGLPIGYISGDQVSGTATKFNATFASLGMTEGVYVNTTTNGNFRDTITVRVGIPEPSSAAILGVCLIAGCLRRRQR